MLGISFPLSAQEYIAETRKFSVEDGLSGRFVHDLTVDQLGTVWISTWLGLNKFDGYNIVSYPQNEYGFQTEKYDGIHIGPHNKIWLIKHYFVGDLLDENLPQAIDIFNPTTEQIENDVLKSFPFDVQEIKQINGDRYNNIWLGLKNGEIYKYNEQGLFKIMQAEIFNWFTVSSESNIAILLPDRTTVVLYDEQHRKIKSHDFENLVTTIKPDNNNGIIAQVFENVEGSKQGIHHYIMHPSRSLEKIKFTYREEEILIKSHRTRGGVAFNVNSQGQFWIHNATNFLVFDGNYELMFKNPIEDIVRFKFWNPEQAWCVSSEGFFGISLRKNLFSNILRDSTLVDTRGITEAEDGTIYINQVQTYSYDPNTKIIKKLNVEGGRDVLVLNDTSLLLSNYGPDLALYNIPQGKSKKFRCIEDSVPVYDAIIVMYKSRKTGKVYLSTEKLGLLNFYPKTNTASIFKEVNQFKEIEKNVVYFFHENKEGIWLGTKLGLFLLDEEKGIQKHIYPNQKSGNPIPCLSMHEDSDGIFWIGSLNQGLYRWNRETDEFIHFSTENGLSDNMIYGIYEDDHNSLWMATNNGINKIHRESYNIATYLTTDGLPHQEFNISSHHKAKDGTLYFGGLGGVTSFHPDIFYAQAEKGQTIIPQLSSLELLEESTGKWVKQNLVSQEELHIELSSSYPSAKISLSAVDKVSKERNQFAYRLGEEDWNYVEGNTIVIDAQSEDKSKLEIMARLRNADWDSELLTLDVQTKQAFFVKSWFLLAAAISFFLFTWFGVQRRKKYKLANLELRETDQKRIIELENKVEKQDAELIDRSVKKEILETPPTANERWYQQVELNAKTLIDNGKFSIMDLAETMNLSERQLRRRFKSLDKHTPIEFMRDLRLVKARELLISKTYNTVAEVSLAVGFSTPKHFSKLFMEKFEKKPSFFLREN